MMNQVVEQQQLPLPPLPQDDDDRASPMLGRPSTTTASAASGEGGSDPHLLRDDGVTHSKSYDDTDDDDDDDDDPVILRNQVALEFMRMGSLGRAATQLEEALELVRLHDSSTRCRRRRSRGLTSSTLSLQLCDVADVGLLTALSSQRREPLGFHPFLKGMEIVRVGSAPLSAHDDDPSFVTDDADASLDQDFDGQGEDQDDDDDNALMVAALCYNLGLVYHQLAIRMFHELGNANEGQGTGDEAARPPHPEQHHLQQQQLQQQQQQQDRRHRQVEGCLRKALRFYDLAVATTTTVPPPPPATTTGTRLAASTSSVPDSKASGMEVQEDIMDVDTTASSASNSTSTPHLLLAIASWANMGHVHYCLRERNEVTYCADHLCLALLRLHDNDNNEETRAADDHHHHHHHHQHDDEGVGSVGTAPIAIATTAPVQVLIPPSLLPLSMNVLLYSEIKNPAPCA